MLQTEGNDISLFDAKTDDISSSSRSFRICRFRRLSGRPQNHSQREYDVADNGKKFILHRGAGIAGQASVRAQEILPASDRLLSVAGSPGQEPYSAAPQPRADQAPAALQRLDERILEYRQNALYIASSTAVTFLVNYGLKKIFRRPRPFITDLHLTPVYRPGEYSFPSGHAQSSFATVTAFSQAYPKWYVIAPSFLWAASVGYSRMYLGVHYPSDVTAGALLGVGTAFGMGFLRP